jgi:putative methyltransferase (TIGR04325 family)
MHKRLAPIVVFAFNRPLLLGQTLKALAANELAEQSELIVYCDGPRHELDAPKVAQVCEIARKAQGFASVTMHERQRNFGLGASIIDGVSQEMARHGRAIILEDDHLSSPYFLRFMNEGLDLYADNPKVASIHGYMYPHELPDPPETFFVRGTDCWGWASWQRAWEKFQPDAAWLLAELDRRGGTQAFDRFGRAGFTGMIEAVAKGQANLWAARWHASAWLADMYTLFPGRSLIFHAGTGADASNCTDVLGNRLDVVLSESPITVSPIAVEPDPRMEKALDQAFLHASGGRKAWLKNRLHHHLRFARPVLRLGKKAATALRKALWAVARPLGKRLIPLATRDQLRALAGSLRTPCLRFSGPYADWKEAKAQAGGYEHETIYFKTLKACRKVRDGQAVCERDSVLFDSPQYDWQLLSCLLWAASQCAGRLRLIDFGGSFGSAYFTHRVFLKDLPELRWHIVEQAHYVERGNKDFANAHLQFHASIDACLAQEEIDGVVFASVLQYLDEPYQLLEDVCTRGFRWILLTRTPFNAGEGESIMLQQVSEPIYNASYPCRLLDEAKMHGILAQRFDLIENFGDDLSKGLAGAHWAGSLWKAKDERDASAPK